MVWFRKEWKNLLKNNFIRI